MQSKAIRGLSEIHLQVSIGMHIRTSTTTARDHLIRETPVEMIYNWLPPKIPQKAMIKKAQVR